MDVVDDGRVDGRVIALVAATASGRAAASSLAAAWGGEVRLYERSSAADALRAAFAECSAVVSFLAVGATVRVLAPLLQNKTSDPAVVCVDEARRFAVAVLGGHHGANELAVLTHQHSAAHGYAAVLRLEIDCPWMRHRFTRSTSARLPRRFRR